MGRKNRPKIKTPKSHKRLTLRQSKFTAAFITSRSLTQAALAAGYSAKHPRQSGYQALQDIKYKAPEVMNEMGLGMHAVIDKYLLPLLNANETKFSQNKGKFTDHVEVEALPIRLGAVRTAFELLGAFPRGSAAVAQTQVGVKVILVDVPRPDRSAIDIRPTSASKGNPPAKKLESDNGHKPDPRLEDEVYTATLTDLSDDWRSISEFDLHAPRLGM